MTACGELGRRDVVLGALAALATGCDGCRGEAGATARPPPGPPEPLPPGWTELSFEPGPRCKDGERALVLTPPGAATLPLLVALHGRGEALRGLEVGAGAWLRDYDLDRVHHRLLAPPLVAADLEDMVTPERLAAINASLAATPYRGAVTACPFCPDLEDPSPAAAATFGRFVCDDLVARVRKDSGCAAPRDRTGIDGVSMGGRLALFVGLGNPDVFGVVGALQPAVHPSEARMFSDMAKAAMARAPVRLRLLTSDKDFFREAVEAVSARMRADGVPHDFLVVRGDHGYEFNRGPGSAEMLLWHDRLAQGAA